MDSLLTAAARALARGNPLAALDRIALREDPPALAMRGIAMAQLEEFASAAALLARAARAFSPRETVARARCTIALAEVALAARTPPPGRETIARAIAVLERTGDDDNALYGHLVSVRVDLLLGRLAKAEADLTALAEGGQLDSAGDSRRAVFELANAQLALRHTEGKRAREALQRAREAAGRARLPALVREVDGALAGLAAPAARCAIDGDDRPVTLEDVERLLGSPRLVVDACRRRVSRAQACANLARRPALFSLALGLAEAAPLAADRTDLACRLFEVTRPNDSHRARLRVEVGRLRRALRGVAAIETTADGGYRLVPDDVVVLRPPVEGSAAALQALLADGERWSTSMLALASGASQRTVQRALTQLETEGRVRALGNGRARRWVAPPSAGFATALLLANLGPAG